MKPSPLSEYELIGRRFILTPLIPQYHRSLYELSISQESSFRWRYRGTLPTYEVFERTLYAGVLCQFIITEASDTSRVCGLVVAYNTSLQDGYSYLAVMTDSRYHGGALEGVALFIRYLFRHWPFRKIYVETPEFNVSQFASAVTVGLLKEEGRFREHQYLSNEYWDVITYAAYREDLQAFADRFESLFLPES